MHWSSGRGYSCAANQLKGTVSTALSRRQGLFLAMRDTDAGACLKL